MSAVVDDEGVTTGDWAASRDPLDCDGDDVPSFESLFLDLEDLFGSFARERTLCLKPFIVVNFMFQTS